MWFALKSNRQDFCKMMFHLCAACISFTFSLDNNFLFSWIGLIWFNGVNRKNKTDEVCTGSVCKTMETCSLCHAIQRQSTTNVIPSANGFERSIWPKSSWIRMHWPMHAIDMLPNCNTIRAACAKSAQLRIILELKSKNDSYVRSSYINVTFTFGTYASWPPPQQLTWKERNLAVGRQTHDRTWILNRILSLFEVLMV